MIIQQINSEYFPFGRACHVLAGDVKGGVTYLLIYPVVKENFIP